MTSRRGPHCPDCPQGKNHKGEPVGHTLELNERNYSGTGDDLYYCDRCGHGFFIKYAIASITYAGKDWDIGSRKERDKEEAARQKAELDKKLQDARELLKNHTGN